MVKTTKIIINELKEYSNPHSKIARLVKDGVYIPIVKGLYETDRSTPAHYLAASIYAPSYLSFEFALAYHSLIPEAVYACTSATFEKRKTKKYETPFGFFIFRDVPSEAYPYGINVYKEGEYVCQIASAEKAVCDQLYKMSKISSQKELERVLFEDLRIDQKEFNKLNHADMIELSDKYGSVNLELLGAYLKRRYKNG
ncbi:MAG: hypothetical protein BWX72_01818 [Firmicutes bacterium ADurb.Bin080]|nr:MAG: hypothetical protein BWX72_01818 [Firmicutes bacterium ADurb.Bin080]